MMEITIGIIGLIIAWMTYHKTFISSQNIDEEKNNFLGIFKATQNLHLEVQSLIQKYINENNGANHLLYPNITFQQYLDLAKQEFEKSLSDESYNNLKNNKKLTKSNIRSLLKMIETQNNALTQFKNQLLFLK